MYKPLPDGLTIKESNVQGLGLFATKDFESDVVLGIVHILNKNFPHGSIRTALGAFYNHSDDPNCKNVAGFWHQHAFRIDPKLLIYLKQTQRI